MRYLSEEALLWLAKPNDCHDKVGKVVHINDNFALGTDGYRIHAINLDNIKSDKIEGLPLKNVVETISKHEIIEEVTVNPRYLLDALEIMRYSGEVTLSISKSEEHIAITIKDKDEIKEKDRTAIVMCIEDRNND